MKKGIFLLVFLLLCLQMSVAAAAADIMKCPRVAVMQFANKAIQTANIRQDDFDSAAEYAIYQLSASGWFDLIDYEQLNAIAKMHQINNSGLVDPATIVQMGKFAGAQFMIVGSVTGLTTKESSVDYQHGRAGGGGFNKHTVIANVSVRAVDIETGRIVVAGLGKGESASTNLEFELKKYRNKKDISETINNTTTTTTNTTTNATVYMEEGMTNEPSTTTETREENSHQTTINHQEEEMNYKVTIGTKEISDVQVRNAISKAIRDAIYGKMGLLTTLNGGKPLKIKTGF